MEISIQYGGGGVLAYFAPWGIFGLGVISTFWLKKSDEKLSKFIRILNYNKYLCIIFVLNIFKYVLFMKRIETFWSRDVTDIWVLSHFEFKTHEDLNVLNCLKYFQIHILGKMS